MWNLFKIAQALFRISNLPQSTPKMVALQRFRDEQHWNALCFFYTLLRTHSISNTTRKKKKININKAKHTNKQVQQFGCSHSDWAWWRKNENKRGHIHLQSHLVQAVLCSCLGTAECGNGAGEVKWVLNTRFHTWPNEHTRIKWKYYLKHTLPKTHWNSTAQCRGLSLLVLVAIVGKLW